MYKTFMFGNPSIIVTTPEACRKVLTDDEAFKPGWPISTMKLIGEKSFIGISYDEHKRLRKLTAAPVNGFESLTMYLEYIEENVVTAFDRWSKMGQIEFLTELRKVTFRIIMYVFLSSESEHAMEALEREYTVLNHGVRAMAINIPGFAYHKALKVNSHFTDIKLLAPNFQFHNQFFFCSVICVGKEESCRNISVHSDCPKGKEESRSSPPCEERHDGSADGG